MIKWNYLVRLKTYSKTTGENILFVQSKFNIPFTEISLQITDYLDVKILLKRDQTTSLWYNIVWNKKNKQGVTQYINSVFVIGSVTIHTNVSNFIFAEDT